MATALVVSNAIEQILNARQRVMVHDCHGSVEHRPKMKLDAKISQKATQMNEDNRALRSCKLSEEPENGRPFKMPRKLGDQQSF